MPLGSQSFIWEGKHPPLMVSGVAILVPASYTNKTMPLVLGGPIEPKLPADYSVLRPLWWRTSIQSKNTSSVIMLQLRALSDQGKRGT